MEHPYLHLVCELLDVRSTDHTVFGSHTDSIMLDMNPTDWLGGQIFQFLHHVRSHQHERTTVVAELVHTFPEECPIAWEGPLTLLEEYHKDRISHHFYLSKPLECTLLRGPWIIGPYNFAMIFSMTKVIHCRQKSQPSSA